MEMTELASAQLVLGAPNAGWLVSHVWKSSKENHGKTIRTNLILENFSNVHGVSCTCKESVILAMKSDTAMLRRDTSKERENRPQP